MCSALRISLCEHEAYNKVVSDVIGTSHVGTWRRCGVELENLEKGRKAKKQVEDDGSVITCLQDYRCAN